jgi:hypothetical protein
MQEAHRILDDPKLQKKQRDILLYYLNRGTVYWMMKDYKQSNQSFQQADYYIEDQTDHLSAEALSMLSNPTVVPYKGEPFEQILLHYYTTLNYIKLGKLDEALVECKRMQLKMQKISDSFKDKNKYHRDAFANLLLGIIYDAQHDYNNAFIAYRNALDIYRNDYKVLNTKVPEQLKKDLIRTAYLNGFNTEAISYEKEFGMQYTPNPDSTGTLLFFWNNGLGPYKDEWDIDFTIIESGRNGMLVFYNAEWNLRYELFLGDRKQYLTTIKVVRVAFPKYISRVPLYKSAVLLSDSPGVTSAFEEVEPIDAIAFKSLEDRVLKEMSSALLRVAIKQAETIALDKLADAQEQKKNGKSAAGFRIASSILSIVNAATEHADTRNWQLLPYSIHYSRISLPIGKQKVNLMLKGEYNTDSKSFEYDIQNNQTTIDYIHSYQYLGVTQRP